MHRSTHRTCSLKTYDCCVSCDTANLVRDNPCGGRDVWGIGALRLGACSCLLSRSTMQSGTSEEKDTKEWLIIIDGRTDGYVVEDVDDLIDLAL